MTIIYIFAFVSAVAFNIIGCSSQSDENPNSRRNPASPSPSSDCNLFLLAECVSQIEGNPNVERDATYPALNAGIQHLTNRTHHVDLSNRSRSRSPSRPPFLEVLGYSLEKLGYLRLIPRTNQSIRFEFRKYVFPVGVSIRLRSDNKSKNLEPNQEYIVLSASNGDIFGILEHSGILRALYRTNKNRSRAKMNMISGEIDNMTPVEIRNCPVGEKHPIFPHTFLKDVSNQNSLRNDSPGPSTSSDSEQHSPERDYRDASPIISRAESPSNWAPSHKVLGYSFEKLGYIRLIPRIYPVEQFEFRRYVFPIDKPIRLLEGKGKRIPVPNREHIVLSTSNGEALAILEHTGFLRGIYRSDRSHSRVKINVRDGVVENMSADEMSQSPVGRKNPVFPDCFKKVHGNYDTLRTVYH